MNTYFIIYRIDPKLNYAFYVRDIQYTCNPKPGLCSLGIEVWALVEADIRIKVYFVSEL